MKNPIDEDIKYLLINFIAVGLSRLINALEDVGSNSTKTYMENVLIEATGDS